MCLDLLPACIYVCYVHAWCPRKSEGDAVFYGTGVTDGCKMLYRC